MTKVVEKKFTSNGDSFNAEITFENYDQAAEAGAKYVVWALQRQARERKLTPGKTVKVDHEGNVYKSIEDKIDEMAEDEAKAALAALQARFIQQNNT